MIKAKLFVLGTVRELLWTDLEYNRFLNHKTGRCGEIPLGGFITLVFASGYDDDRLLRWMTHSRKGELCSLTEGEIVFYLGNFDGIVLFKYRFNDAALIYWKEKFTAVGEEPMTVTITISAAIQEVKGVTLVKPWQESWISPSEQMPYQSEETEDNEPKVIDYYITDLENNKNPEYKVGDQIYVVAKTKNMIGKELTMNLANKTKDFKYKGKLLPNDKLENYPIGSNTERIKLEIVGQQKSSN